MRIQGIFPGDYTRDAPIFLFREVSYNQLAHVLIPLTIRRKTAGDMFSFRGRF